MKKRILIASAAGALVLGSIISVKDVVKKSRNPFFEANLEALSRDEEPVLTNLHMHIWWVEEHFGGEAITCTFGGELPCE